MKKWNWKIKYNQLNRILLQLWRKHEIDYYLSLPYVMQYFINKDNISKGEIVASKPSESVKRKPHDRNILDFFNTQPNDEPVKTEMKPFEIGSITFAESKKKKGKERNQKMNIRY